jgi:hypothetical protein
MWRVCKKASIGFSQKIAINDNGLLYTTGNNLKVISLTWV